MDILIKLCDFGATEFVKKKFSKNIGIINTNTNGTCLYWSPEKVISIVNNKKYINAYIVDIYALELTILIAWTVQYPYKNRYNYSNNNISDNRINKEMSIIWNEPLKDFKIPQQLKDIFKHLK